VYRKEKSAVPVLAREINGEPVIVTRAEVSGYVNNPVFLQMLEYWHYTKLWGMSNGHGWANEPMDVLQGITFIELEAKAIEAESLESKRDSRASKDNIHSGRS